MTGYGGTLGRASSMNAGREHDADGAELALGVLAHLLVALRRQERRVDVEVVQHAAHRVVRGASARRPDRRSWSRPARAPARTRRTRETALTSLGTASASVAVAKTAPAQNVATCVARPSATAPIARGRARRAPSWSGPDLLGGFGGRGSDPAGCTSRTHASSGSGSIGRPPGPTFARTSRYTRWRAARPRRSPRATCVPTGNREIAELGDHREVVAVIEDDAVVEAADRAGVADDAVGGRDRGARRRRPRSRGRGATASPCERSCSIRAEARARSRPSPGASSSVGSASVGELRGCARSSRASAVRSCAASSASSVRSLAIALEQEARGRTAARGGHPICLRSRRRRAARAGCDTRRARDAGAAASAAASLLVDGRERLVESSASSAASWSASCARGSGVGRLADALGGRTARDVQQRPARARAR